MSSIAIVSPGYPGQPGGVTDHTARLVRHWRDEGHEVVVAGEIRDPAATIAEWRGCAVRSALIQYVPFLYGRRGLSAYPERLTAAATAAGIRVLVFVHEPWVPFTRPQWWITGPLQRRQLRRLVKRASASVTPVPAWRELLDPKPSLQYVGSTLGNPDGQQSGSEIPTPVIFSPFSAGLNWPWIAAAVNAIGTRLMIVGASENEARSHPAVARWIQPGWEWKGRVNSEAGLGMLARARLVLAPFIDGITARRTSACAALSTGTRVISSTGPLFDPAIGEGCELAADEREFAERAARVWRASDSAGQRAGRVAWYRATLDPVMLDRQLLQRVLEPSTA